MLAYSQYAVFVTALMAFTKFNMERGIVAGRRKCKAVGWCLEWFLFTLLASMRVVDDVYGGSDSREYVAGFLYDYEYSSEKLFYMIGRLIRNFTDNYHVYFFVIYGVIVFGILLFAAEMFRERVSLPILFLYFNSYADSFGILRQYLAIAIGMIAFVLVHRKKRAMGMAVMLVAGLIHFTMLSLVLVLAYYDISMLKSKIKTEVRKPTGRLISGIIINVAFVVISGIIIFVVSRTEYSAYVEQEVLKNISWFGYIPSIVCLIVALYYEKNMFKYGCDRTMMVFAWAHFSTLYLGIGLGIFRLMLCFFPVRVYILDRLKKVLCSKFIMGRNCRQTVPALFDMIVVLDGMIYMWKTISNGALPYFLDMRLL